MRQFLALGIAGVVVVGTPVQARPWARIATSSTGEAIWIDIGSIAEDQGQRVAWIRTRYPRPNNEGAVEDVTLVAFHCSSRESAIVDYVLYDRDGNAIYSRRQTGLNWRRSVPDSVGAREVNFVCSYPMDTPWRAIQGLEVEE